MTSVVELMTVKVFWLERALAEPRGKEVRHFITNALRSIQVVAQGRVNKENLGTTAVNHFLVVLRQAKQRVQARISVHFSTYTAALDSLDRVCEMSLWWQHLFFNL